MNAHEIMDSKWTARGVNGIAMLLLASTLAHWTWSFLAPGLAPSRTVSAAASKASFDQISVDLTSRHLFGEAKEEVAATVSPDILKDVALIGVFAHGLVPMAILRMDGKDTPVQKGEALTAGALLDDIFPDHVAVRVGSSLVSIFLKTDHPDLSLRNQAIEKNTPPQPETMSVASRQDLEDLKLGTMGQFSDSPQGLRVDTVSPGGALEKNGIKSGDVLQLINGKNITSMKDLIAEVQAMFATTGIIKVEGKHENGAKFSIQYNLQ